MIQQHLYCRTMNLASYGEVNEWSNKTFPSCSSGVGNLDFALYTLSNFGTVTFKDFGSVRNVNANELKSILSNSKTIAKIKNPEELISECSYQKQSESIQKIKAALLIGKPVVCAIKQFDAKHHPCDENFIRLLSQDMAPVSNHIVTIIGYDEIAQKFEVKNNYQKDCSFWVNCKRMLSVTSWAYCFDVDVIKH